MSMTSVKCQTNTDILVRFLAVVRQDLIYLRHGKADTTVLSCDARTVLRSAASTRVPPGSTSAPVPFDDIPSTCSRPGSRPPKCWMESTVNDQKGSRNRWRHDMKNQLG